MRLVNCQVEFNTRKHSKARFTWTRFAFREGVTELYRICTVVILYGGFANRNNVSLYKFYFGSL